MTRSRSRRRRPPAKPGAQAARTQATRTLADLLRAVERIAPPGLAEAWDNFGLQVGDPNQPVRRVMTCLELTAPTLAEAVKRHADAVVAHHPLIFKPMKQLNFAQPGMALVAELVLRGISLVAAHTNLDAARWGTNQVLAEACGLTALEPLLPRDEEELLKFVVYVPVGHEQKIIEAIARGGGGCIGAYSHCTFRAKGTGTFKGGAGTEPVIGKPGELEQAEEFRIETVVPASAKRRLVREVRAAHPYEEMAYDLFPMDNARRAGLGCVAKLLAPMTALELAASIKKQLKPASMRLSGPAQKKVRRVALCSGGGGSFIGRAAAAGADAYITGEINYHQGVEAHQRGIAVIEVGHFESEELIAAPLALKLAADAAMTEGQVEFFAAKKELQPFMYV